MVAPSYTNLYAVPKDSFDQYIKHKAGALGNVKNIKVNQLNINEAEEITPYYTGNGLHDPRSRPRRRNAPNNREDNNENPDIDSLGNTNNGSANPEEGSSNADVGGNSFSQVNIDETQSEEQQAGVQRLSEQIPAELEQARRRGRAYQYISSPTPNISIPAEKTRSFTPERLLTPRPRSPTLNTEGIAAENFYSDPNMSYAMQNLPPLRPIPNLATLGNGNNSNRRESNFNAGINENQTSTPITANPVVAQPTGDNSSRNESNRIYSPITAKQVFTPKASSGFNEPFPSRQLFPSKTTGKKKRKAPEDLRRKLAHHSVINEANQNKRKRTLEPENVLNTMNNMIDRVREINKTSFGAKLEALTRLHYKLVDLTEYFKTTVMNDSLNKTEKNRKMKDINNYLKTVEKTIHRAEAGKNISSPEAMDTSEPSRSRSNTNDRSKQHQSSLLFTLGEVDKRMSKFRDRINQDGSYIAPTPRDKGRRTVTAKRRLSAPVEAMEVDSQKSKSPDRAQPLPDFSQPLPLPRFNEQGEAVFDFPFPAFVPPKAKRGRPRKPKPPPGTPKPRGRPPKKKKIPPSITQAPRRRNVPPRG